MALSSDLVSEFAKALNDSRNDRKEVTVYGTISIQNKTNYVKIDGSDELTPVVSTVGLTDGDRVMVSIKQHHAVVTGNLTDPSFGADKIEFTVEDKVNGLRAELEITAEAITSKVEAAEKAAGDAKGYAESWSEVKQTAEDIQSTVKKFAEDVTGYETTWTTIKQEADAITSTVTSLKNEAETAANNAKDYAESWSEVKQTADEFSVTLGALKDAAETAAGEAEKHYTQFVQDTEGFLLKDEDGNVWINNGCLNLTGAITFDDLDKDAQTEINSAKSVAGLAYSKAMDAESAAGDAYAKAVEAYNLAGSGGGSVEIPSYISGTTIDKATIQSPKIYGGEFYAVGEDSFVTIDSDGMYLYRKDTDLNLDDTIDPKISLSCNSDGSIVQVILGAGDKDNDNYTNRVYLQKSSTAMGLYYYAPDGKGASGIHIDRYGNVSVMTNGVQADLNSAGSGSGTMTAVFA